MAKKNQDEIDHEVLIANVRSALDTRHGQELIWYILELADIYGTQFTGNSGTFFNEGRRSVGLDLIALMDDADPTSYAKLLLAKQKQKEGQNE